MNYWAILLSLFIAFSAPTFADDHKLSEIPPIELMHAYQSSTDPLHYVLLGLTTTDDGANLWYVIDSLHGFLTAPKLLPHSFIWQSGGFDMFYESGEVLHIPRDKAIAGSFYEDMPAGLIDPFRGREPLHPVAVTPGLLEHLGVTKMVKPEMLERLDHKVIAIAAPEKPKALDEDVVLVQVDLGEVKDLGANVHEILEKNQIKPINVMQVAGAGPRTLYVWTFESRGQQTKQLIENSINRPAVIKKSIMDGEAIEKPILTSKDFFKLELIERVRTFARILQKWETKPMVRSPELLDRMALNMYYYLASAEIVLGWNMISRANLQYWENGDIALAQLKEHFEAPLHQLMERGYRFLHQMQTPMAREILFLKGEAVVPRIDLLYERAGPTLGTHFENWLKMLGDRVRWARKVTLAEAKGGRVEMRTGALFEEIPLIQGKLRDFRPRSKNQMIYEDSKTMFPLLVFGEADQPKFRRAVARFIIEMDKEAWYQQSKLGKDHDEPVIGNLTLVTLIQAFNLLPQTALFKLDGRPFSKALYFRQVMMIVNDVLQTANFTIGNGATYLALLDAAMALQRSVANEFGLPPNRGAWSDDELDDLTEELLSLQKTVQTRLLRAVFADLSDENCETWLLPK